MKCVSCGKQDFFKAQMKSKEFDMLICLICGYVNFYLPEDKLKAQQKYFKELREKEEKIADLEKQQKTILALIESQEIIAENSNNSNKVVKEAEEKIEKLNDQLDQIVQQLKELKEN